MKIVYHHRTRGTDAQRVHITEMVRAFRSLGHEVHVVSVAGSGDKDDPSRDAGEACWKPLVRRLPFAYEAVQLAYNPIGLVLLLWRLLQERPDFIYERYALFNVAGVLAARWMKVPIVLEVNSPLALEQGRDGEIRAAGLARRVERWTCNAADRVLAVSGPLKKILVHNGVDETRVLVMTNAVNTEDLCSTQEGERVRSSLGLADKVVIGFVGWFRDWHGLDLLLEAFRRSRKNEDDLRLLLVGDGPAMPGLRRFVKEHRLADCVVFTGPARRAEVAAYLEAMDVAVQPAANEYCCPMKILEYMALGKPIVAPRQENIEELVTDGQEGVLFTPRDPDCLARALTKLAKDEELRRALGLRAADAIRRRRLTWQASAERVLDLVLSAGSSRSVNRV